MSAIPIVNLAEVLEMSVAFNRNAAGGRGVRLHCYSLDQLPVQGEQYALLDVLDRLIGSAVRDALWGTEQGRDRRPHPPCTTVIGLRHERDHLDRPGPRLASWQKAPKNQYMARGQHGRHTRAAA